MNTNEQEVLKQMVNIYTPNGYDWMDTPITKNNPLTYHHIIGRKVGNTSVSNGALLTKSSHRRLNMLKTKDNDLYEEWQWLFYAINVSMTHPLLPYKEMMEELKMQTEEVLYKKDNEKKLTYKKNI